jgi:hypothetical protein
MIGAGVVLLGQTIVTMMMMMMMMMINVWSEGSAVSGQVCMCNGLDTQFCHSADNGDRNGPWNVGDF